MTDQVAYTFFGGIATLATVVINDQVVLGITIPLFLAGALWVLKHAATGRNVAITRLVEDEVLVAIKDLKGDIDASMKDVREALSRGSDRMSRIESDIVQAKEDISYLKGHFNALNKKTERRTDG